MMKTICEQTMLGLSEHLDEGITLSAETRQHLAHCADCAEFYQQWNTSGTLHECATAAPSSFPALSIVDEVMTRIEPKATPQQSKKRSNIIKFWIPAAAAACFALVMTLQTENQQTPQDTTIAEHHASPEEVEQMNQMMDNLNRNKQQLSKSLIHFSESGTQAINGGSRKIAKVTSGIEYISTNLSNLVPKIPASDDQTSLGRDDHNT